MPETNLLSEFRNEIEPMLETLDKIWIAMQTTDSKDGASAQAMHGIGSPLIHLRYFMERGKLREGLSRVENALASPRLELVQSQYPQLKSTLESVSQKLRDFCEQHPESVTDKDFGQGAFSRL